MSINKKTPMSEPYMGKGKPKSSKPTKPAPKKPGKSKGQGCK